tara:strand:+ start:33 stop:293 length:261 start_codon:yes stop_codon:yes gene_type:complete
LIEYSHKLEERPAKVARTEEFLSMVLQEAKIERYINALKGATKDVRVEGFTILLDRSKLVTRPLKLVGCAFSNSLRVEEITSKKER